LTNYRQYLRLLAKEDNFYVYAIYRLSRHNAS